MTKQSEIPNQSIIKWDDYWVILGAKNDEISVGYSLSVMNEVTKLGIGTREHIHNTNIQFLKDNPSFPSFKLEDLMQSYARISTKQGSILFSVLCDKLGQNIKPVTVVKVSPPPIERCPQIISASKENISFLRATDVKKTLQLDDEEQSPPSPTPPEAGRGLRLVK